MFFEEDIKCYDLIEVEYISDGENKSYVGYVFRAITSRDKSSRQVTGRVGIHSSKNYTLIGGDGAHLIFDIEDPNIKNIQILKRT